MKLKQRYYCALRTPQGVTEHFKFMSKLTDVLTENNPIIFGGDLNMVEDPVLDKIGHNVEKKVKSPRVLNRLKR